MHSLRKSLAGSFVVFACVILSLSVGSIYCGCSKSDPSSPDTNDTDGWQFDLIAPDTIPPGIEIPLIIQIETIEKRSYGWHSAAVYIDDSPSSTLTLKRGALTTSFSSDIPGYHEVVISGSFPAYGCSLVVAEPSGYRVLEGHLSGDDLLWTRETPIHVQSTVEIDEGTTLIIEAGTLVLLDEDVALRVEGAIEVYGTEEDPVIFAPRFTEEPWGNIYLDHSSATMQWTVFTGGGGNEEATFGHSDSQPVLFADVSQANLDHCFFVDNPGKAMASYLAEVELHSCIITRCDTGGEHWSSQVTITDSWFLDMPNGTSEEIDDDNDGIYLYDALDDSHPSLIRDCVFATGKDDAIDHNMAIVRVESCVIEDFDNEGIAASNDNSIEIVNSLFLNNEQGVEAGYGSPTVIVDHCVFIGNETGIRFGDWYEWRDPEGILTVTNSISVDNSLYNCWNWVASTGQARENALQVTYSLVNDILYDYGEGNITGEPSFQEDYLLTPNSPGIGAGSDGSNLGLY